ncbi:MULTISPECIES: oxygenase MpaB family protein [Streptomyces]|uniref:Oxygenase MpaB family protein n=1 Tax=Streptomyces solicathayae TaxID=3081768 RepID=A0ABZ0LLA2_9ACTN|nr:oxygenase MpaB family protein [Streptomyces sp. HUAS YS2]WOX20282.1 oxygenase MpaB family protein [Streptomyces sp. HUAS YS2]
MGWPPPTVDDLRERLGSELFRRVAGPSGEKTRARIHETPGPRWFGPDRPIRTVHGDAAMFTGGLAALLLQSLHPLAMAAVAAHSGFRGDPWGRLQRTSTFLAVTTFGTADDARRAVERVRVVHERVRGTTPDGREYHASDPHLLGWVHVAEVDSFLRAHRRYGKYPLDLAGYDGYVADTARIAEELGVERPPRSLAELARRMEAYRGELDGTREARETARYLLLSPPIPWQARAPYALLAAGAVELLPSWARGQLGLPTLPGPARAAARVGGRVATVGIRWVMAPPPPDAVPLPRARPGGPSRR